MERINYRKYTTRNGKTVRVSRLIMEDIIR